MEMSLQRLSRDGLADLADELSDFILSPLVRQITGGIHVNDALIHDAWGALPPEWTTYWDRLSDHRVAQRQLIDSIGEDNQAQSCPPNVGDATAISFPPTSLVTWLDMLKAVSLPRAQRHPGPILTLPEALTSGMKTKKINEVSIAAAYIYKVCQSNGITRIIDMGSGQGYLSVTLAFLFPTLRILAIDGSESQVAGSQAFASSLGIADDRLTHLVRYIDGSAPLAAELEAWAGGQTCMLVGLHACGNLSEHMLRYFRMCPSITRLGAVGCCYNHIVPRSDKCPEGFPISERLRRRGVTLSATALMTGCQAPNNWERPDVGRGGGSSSVYSRRQFYRAVVEKLLHDKGIITIEGSGSGSAEVDRPNWGIRKGDLISFEKFTRRALHCLGVAQDSISSSDIQEFEGRYRDYEGRIAILWTLSVLCCKAVESVIALDRYCFLIEHGFEGVDVVPIFDYKVSPRNLMIVAEKR